MFTVNTDWMVMKLGPLLHLVGLNRNTFNTLNRRNPLQFLERDLRDERSYDRYTMTHAVAVGCVVEFMAAGLAAARAVSAVDSMFQFVDAATHTISEAENDNRWWLTVISYADGSYGWMGGLENADTFGD
jgi:protein-L-isoaspartate O-methyltransferase